MKRIPKYLLILLTTFFFGLTAASIWLFYNQKFSLPPAQPKTVNSAENPLAEVETESVETEDEFHTPLDNVWLKDQKISYNGYTITNKCSGTEADDDCKLKISKNGKTLETFESSRNYWLQYGFFNFLGKDDKQLIVHTYSGGAHCCYDYTIYDLKPNFRTIYDSTKFDGAVGDSLIPVDIDSDGIFEFQQDVMAFDYAAPGGHATSTFPPAVFAYNQKKGRYDFANKLFPNYVLDELKKNLAGHDKWVKECAKYGTIITQEELHEISVRETFLYLTYAGKEKEGWEYFNENYNFEFRGKFRKDFEEEFSKDATYRSIYSQ